MEIFDNKSKSDGMLGIVPRMVFVESVEKYTE